MNIMVKVNIRPIVNEVKTANNIMHADTLVVLGKNIRNVNLHRFRNYIIIVQTSNCNNCLILFFKY